MLFADLRDRPYGRQLNFLEFGIMPDPSTMQQVAGKSHASVEDEKKALEEKGLYYKEGEGPSLELLGEAWTAYFVRSESTSGHVAKASLVGKDGYYETARAAIETALCLVFDRKELPYKGGVLPPTVAMADKLLIRLQRSNLRINVKEWIPHDTPYGMIPPAFAPS
eukprot:694021-Amphidinium_carterae.1